jgi:hypothetical protein
MPACLPGQVLERLRKVAAAKGRTIATMLDTKGPEIRTAMLKGHHPVEIEVRAAGHTGPGGVMETLAEVHGAGRCMGMDTNVKQS